jgi:hypothetical protein
MNRNVAEAARILEVNGQQVKTWASAYKDRLSGQANPGKGKPRLFTDSDVLALMYVCDRSESGEPADEISAGLDREDHFGNDRYRDLLYAHTPILQEPPDDLDETWRHGILLAGGGVDGYLALARNYRECAEALLEAALKSGEPRDWSFPVLFAYRHTLELYLKIIGEIDENTHSLRKCVLLVEKRHGERLPSRAREWIIELDEIDPKGMTFRYADDNAGKAMRNVEYWVDFGQFKFAMTRVFRMLDTAILNASRDGKIENLRL